MPRLNLNSKIPPLLSMWLNIIRFSAAVFVLWSHLPRLVFAANQNVFFNWSINQGKTAVLIFFVLSGYLVGGQFLQQVLTGKQDWRQYALNRSVRIYLVLIPAIILGLFLDNIGLRFANTTGIYNGKLTVYGIVDRDFALCLDWDYLVTPLVALHTILRECPGSNGALWSLCNEMWYYALWPIMLLPLYRRWSVRSALLFGAGLVAMSCLFVLNWRIILFFGLWIAGALCRLIPLPQTRIPKIGRIVDYLSDCTYTLYAVHVPIVVLFCALSQKFCGVGLQSRLDDPRAWLVVILGFIFVVLFAHALSLITERQAKSLRKKLAGLLLPDSSAVTEREPAIQVTAN